MKKLNSLFFFGFKKPRFYLKFFAIDDDDANSSIIFNTTSFKENLIDYYIIDFNFNQNIRPSTSSKEIEWIKFPFLYGQSASANLKT